MNKHFEIFFILFLIALASCGKKTDSNPAPVVNTLLNISDVQQVRDNANAINFHFTVNVENPSAKTITVQYATVDETAKAGTEYTAKSGTLTIPANERYATLDVSVKGDSLREAEKLFYIQLSNPTNAKLYATGKGTGTIICDGTFLPVDDAGYKTPSTYPGYTLSWSDDFDGTALNNNSWNYETGASGWGNNELENYTSSYKNSFITKGGYLVIEARKETAGNNYTSARIQTKGKKEFTYGRVDIRAKLPKGKGIWPALWMLGGNISTTSWPASGEIDIMELLGHEPGKTYGTMHWGNAGGPSTHIGKEYVLPSGDFSQAFHVFSIIWTADKIEWYIDDVKFFTGNKSDVSGNYPFDKSFFFIFNVAVGGNWPGNPDASTVFPQRMIVDYIRVFQ
jgi:Beta-glucanase/Beta-glucan synthetase